MWEYIKGKIIIIKTFFWHGPKTSELLDIKKTEEILRGLEEIQFNIEKIDYKKVNMELTSKLISKEQNLTDQTDKINEMEEKKKEYQNTIKDLQNLNEELKTKINQLEEEKEITISTNEKLHTVIHEKKELQENNENIKTQNIKLNILINKNQEEIKTYIEKQKNIDIISRKKLEKNEADIQQLTKNLIETDATIKNLNIKNENLINRNTKLNEQVDEKEITIKELKKNMEKMKHEMEEKNTLEKNEYKKNTTNLLQKCNKLNDDNNELLRVLTLYKNKKEKEVQELQNSLEKEIRTRESMIQKQIEDNENKNKEILRSKSEEYAKKINNVELREKETENTNAKLICEIRNINNNIKDIINKKENTDKLLSNLSVLKEEINIFINDNINITRELVVFTPEENNNLLNNFKAQTICLKNELYIEKSSNTQNKEIIKLQGNMIQKERLIQNEGEKLVKIAVDYIKTLTKLTETKEHYMKLIQEQTMLCINLHEQSSKKLLNHQNARIKDANNQIEYYTKQIEKVEEQIKQKRTETYLQTKAYQENIANYQNDKNIITMDIQKELAKKNIFQMIREIPITTSSPIKRLKADLVYDLTGIKDNKNKKDPIEEKVKALKLPSVPKTITLQLTNNLQEEIKLNTNSNIIITETIDPDDKTA